VTGPFTIEQFLGVFVAYNCAIWPIQILAYGLGLIAVSAHWFRTALVAQLILSILALMWAVNRAN
jgi:integral membrane sensor domain MASE1